MMAAVEMRNGNIVIGTNNGLLLYNRHHNSVEPFPGAEVLEDYAVKGIKIDRGHIVTGKQIGRAHV